MAGRVPVRLLHSFFHCLQRRVVPGWMMHFHESNLVGAIAPGSLRIIVRIRSTCTMCMYVYVMHMYM